MSKRKLPPKRRKPKEAAKPIERRPRSPYPLTFSRRGIWDGPDQIIEDAPIASVVYELFADSYTREGRPSILHAVIQCAVDDLAELEQAHMTGAEIHETKRIVERIRNRLVIGQWLEERMLVVSVESEASS